LCTAFKTCAGLEKIDGVPVNLPKLPTRSETAEVKKEFLFKHIGKFVDEFVLVEFDVERAWREAGRQEQQITPHQESDVHQMLIRCSHKTEHRYA